jgi:transcriptional regulator with XRE-family HTH domain
MDTTIGMRLQAVRKAAKVSQEEMARRLGKAKASVCRYEWGEAPVDIALINTFVQHCGFDPSGVVPRWIGFGGPPPTKRIADKLHEVVRDRAGSKRSKAKGAA